MDQIRDISQLKENTEKKVRAALAELKSQGYHVRVSETLRSKDRQHWLYGKGRTAAQLRNLGCPVEYAQPNEPQVTRTMNSNHLTGCAVDIFFDPSVHGHMYNVGDKTWRAVADIFKRFGMDWGFDLRGIDKPHFQDDGTDYKEQESDEKIDLEGFDELIYKAMMILPKKVNDSELKGLLNRAKYEMRAKFII